MLWPIWGFRLALLAVSSTLVNLLMTHVLPMKALYKDHKYDVTEDFSVWRDNKKAFEHEKKKAQERNAGTREDTGVSAHPITSYGVVEKVSGSAVHSPVGESIEAIAVPPPKFEQPHATLAVTEC